MGSRYKGTKSERAALSAFINLTRAADALSRMLSPELSAAGLTESEFGALEALFHLGPMCQADLGRKILRSGGNMTFVLDNLEEAGLVRRERGDDDRRYVRVSLTEKGRRLIAKLFPEHAQRVCAALRGLTEAELEQLRTLCRKAGGASA